MYKWALSQPLPYGRFEYVKDISMFTHDFIIIFDKISDLGYTEIVNIDYLEHLI